MTPDLMPAWNSRGGEFGELIKDAPTDRQSRTVVEDRIPARHPLRLIRRIVNDVLDAQRRVCQD
jgi:hypothetical protein